MRPAIEFSAKHNIKPHLSTYKLEDLPKMVEIMNAHKAQGRMGVVFDQDAERVGEKARL